MTSHQEWPGILLGRFFTMGQVQIVNNFLCLVLFLRNSPSFFVKCSIPIKWFRSSSFFEYIKAKTLASAHIYIFIHISHMVFFFFFQTKKEERNTLYIFHLTLFCLVQLAESRHQIYSNIFFHTYLFSKFLYVIRYKKSYVISVFCYVVYQIFFFATSIK